MEDKTFLAALEMSRDKEKDSNELVIEDVKDGQRYKTCKFFVENPDALCLMFYSDAIEVTNPLAAGKGKHKLVNVYFQVADVPRFQRSNINRLLLGMVFQEKLLKRYTYSTILKPLFSDLLKLECEGVNVNKPIDRTVKAGLLLYSGDNLGKNICLKILKWYYILFLL